MASSLAQYLAYSQPGTGQTPITPQMQSLTNKDRTHWLELLGDMAMYGAGTYTAGQQADARNSGLAKMLAGGAATLGGDESIGVPDTANPWHDAGKYSQMSQLLATNPEMAPFFQAQAYEKRFPEVFGEAPELGKVYDPATGNYVYGPITEGAIAEPGGASGGNWASLGDGTLYRTGPNGQPEFATAPNAGGGGIPGLSMPTGGGGGAAPMQAISQIESGGNPNATSPMNAIGEFQILTKDPKTGQPGATALEIATELGDQFAIDMLQQGDVTGFEQYVRDPQINAQYGEHYFNKMKERYSGNEILAAAAYNAGPGRVDDALAVSGGDPNAFFAALPAETQGYIQKYAGLTGGAEAAPAATGQGVEALAAGVPYPRAKGENEHEANALYLREQAMAQGIELPAQTQAYIDAYAPTEKGPEFDRQIARFNELDGKVIAGTATDAERNERKALKKKLGLGSNYTGTETQGRYLAGAKALDNLMPVMDDLLAKGYQPDGMAQVLNGLQGEGDSLWASIANAALSPDDQVFFQILYQLSDAVNRPVSGAAITAEDLKNAFRQYVPMAGDSPATIARKKDALMARRESFYNVAGFEGEDIPQIGAPKGSATSTGVQWQIVPE